MEDNRDKTMKMARNVNDMNSADRKALYDNMLIDLEHENVRQQGDDIKRKIVWIACTLYVLIIAYGKFHYLLPWHVAT